MLGCCTETPSATTRVRCPTRKRLLQHPSHPLSLSTMVIMPSKYKGRTGPVAVRVWGLQTPSVCRPST